MTKKSKAETPYQITEAAFATDDIAGLLLRAAEYQYRASDLFGVTAPDLFTIYQDGLVPYAGKTSRSDVAARIMAVAVPLSQTSAGREALRLIAYCEEYNRQNKMSDLTLGLPLDKLRRICDEAEANTLEPESGPEFMGFAPGQLIFPGF